MIEIFVAAFPGRVRGVYLRGSHASGTSIDGCDLDLFVVFKDRFVDGAEYERARALSAGQLAELAFRRRRPTTTRREND